LDLAERPKEDTMTTAAVTVNFQTYSLEYTNETAETMYARAKVLINQLVEKQGAPLSGTFTADITSGIKTTIESDRKPVAPKEEPDMNRHVLDTTDDTSAYWELPSDDAPKPADKLNNYEFYFGPKPQETDTAAHLHFDATYAPCCVLIVLDKDPSSILIQGDDDMMQVAYHLGYRDSEQDWYDFLRDCEGISYPVLLDYFSSDER
jgi:hypothetical protein